MDEYITFEKTILLRKIKIDLLITSSNKVVYKLLEMF